MIVPMKKAWVVVQSKDADSALNRLRSLGVLHVEHQRSPQGIDINALREDILTVNRVIDILTETEFSEKCDIKHSRELSDWKFTAQHIIDLWKRFDQLKEYSRHLIRQISQWETWGDFDPELIRILSQKNIHIRLYRVPVKELKNFPPGVIVKKISIVKGISHCVAISQEKVGIPFKEIEMPKMGLEKMRARLSEDQQVTQSIRNDLCKHISYRESFKNIKNKLEKELEFREALRGMAQAKDIMYLTGYIPFDTIGLLTLTSKKQKWGLLIADPSGEDNVPTLIRNPRWISFIRPIFKIIEVVPGYRELDISLWFLVFFSVFFGMLIGDAAYGIIFFILTLFAQKRWAKKIGEQSVFILFYLLSSCAIIWGLLTGTFFGQEWLPQWTKPLVPALRDTKNMQTLCFLLGAIHLSIAHSWRTIIKLPSLTALSEIGWILILWGAFFLAKALILGDNFPIFAKWLIIIGASFVVLFTNPRKNILKGVGAGFGNLLLNLVNNFTDIVSYIRIFAVGLATVAVADATNAMAKDFGFNSIATGVLTSITLLIGHTVNIILGPLAVLVHGVRLNLLEFCNHLDIKWSGFAYKPLQEENNIP